MGPWAESQSSFGRALMAGLFTCPLRFTPPSGEPVTVNAEGGTLVCVPGGFSEERDERGVVELREIRVHEDDVGDFAVGSKFALLDEDGEVTEEYEYRVSGTGELRRRSGGLWTVRCQRSRRASGQGRGRR